GTAAVLADMIAALIRKEITRALGELWREGWAAGEDEAGGSAAGGLEAFLGTWGEQVIGWVSATNTAAVTDALGDLAGLKRKHLTTELLRLLNVDERAEAIAISELTRAWNAALLDVW